MSQFVSGLTNAPSHSLSCCPLKVVKMKMRLETAFTVLVNNICRPVRIRRSGEALRQPNQRRGGRARRLVD